MQKPEDDIRVGIIIFPYSSILRGWIAPDGELVKNPIKAQRMAEEMNRSITIH